MLDKQSITSSSKQSARVPIAIATTSSLYTNGSYISWTRRDGLKMVADKHVRLRLSDCYCCATFAFEGSENGTTWTEIARIQTSSNDYTYTLEQIAVYTHYRIRSLCDTKLRKIEVD